MPDAQGQPASLLVLTITATARIGSEKVGLQCRRCIGRHGNRCRPDQDRVADDARKPKCVASEGYAGSRSPHEAQGLQDIMSQRHVSDVAQRARLRVENEVPTRKDHLSHLFTRITCALRFWALTLSFAARWRQKSNRSRFLKLVRLCATIGPREIRA